MLTFEYRAATAPRDAKAFLAKIIETKKFWRNERSQIMYEAKPKDFVRLDGKLDLMSILEDEKTPLKITGDVGDLDCFPQLWQWLTSNKWRLERLNPERPWTPERPANTGSGLQQKQRWQS